MKEKRITGLANFLVFLQFSSLFAIALSTVINFKSDYLLLSILLFLFAAIILIFAFIALRPSLRVNPVPKEGARFISAGIYRYIRHPMYSALMLLATGLVAISGSPFSFILWGVLILTLLVKGRLEDYLLAAIHPANIEYQHQVPGFIPNIRKISKY